MKSYSLDIRQRVMKVYDEKRLSVRAIAERFKVGEWWIHKIKRQREKTGKIDPLKGKVGQPRKITGSDLRRLKQYVDKKPDATLEEIHDNLNLRCSVITIHNTLNRLGYRFKKNSTRQRTRSA